MWGVRFWLRPGCCTPAPETEGTEGLTGYTNTRRLVPTFAAPWHCDIDQQYACFVQTRSVAGEQRSVHEPPKTTQPYLSAATLELTQYCKALRRYLYDEAAERRRRLQDLKNPANLYGAVRKGFPTARSARRSGLKPLPAVLKPDGAMAVTPAERSECWRQRFAGQEAGVVVDDGEYVERFKRQAWRNPPLSSWITCQRSRTLNPSWSSSKLIKQLALMPSLPTCISCPYQQLHDICFCFQCWSKPTSP